MSLAWWCSCQKILLMWYQQLNLFLVMFNLIFCVCHNFDKLLCFRGDRQKSWSYLSCLSTCGISLIDIHKIDRQHFGVLVLTWFEIVSNQSNFYVPLYVIVLYKQKINLCYTSTSNHARLCSFIWFFHFDAPNLS